MTEALPAVSRPWGMRALLGAVLISSVGEAMVIVAVPWFVLEATGSAARTGVLLAVGAVSSGLAGLLAGPLVDRWGFKRMAVTAWVFGGAAAACIPVLHHLGRLDFATLIALTVAASVLDVPGVAAVTGLVPGLAGAARMPLERGNALLGGVHQAAQLAGVPLGGLATATLGADTVLALDALGCLLAAFLILVGVPSPGPTPSAPAAEAPAGREPSLAVRAYLDEIRVGLRLLWRERLVRALACSGAAFNALDSGLAGVLLAVYAHRELGSAAGLGVMLTAFSVGVLVGTGAYAVVGHRFGRRPAYLASGAGVGLLVAGLAVVSPSLPTAAVLLGLLGVVAAPVGPVRTTAFQRELRAETYGRVVSAVDTIGTAAVPLGAAATAVAAESLGVRPALAALAVAYLAVVTACWRSSALRTL
ncbi:MFS transporter [Streptomyces sp. NBC_00525]|uniref:MFS transporter n=1 Tax=Streptomyces sp. NBC_00525 TaxID=2903660 RepID=UPI002E812D6D|nr:MFS transporter [Streptomyces sp. NBC_00525]WUC94835.1 MFS transporter [Streptomyces sp. NBC_00525]